MTPEKLRPLLIERARAEGFEAVRITGTDSTPQAGPRLGEWLDAGRHGSMEWMAERVEWRASARALWPDAKSVIVLGQNYGPEHDPRPLLAEGDRGNISVYARGDDYHDVVKGRLKRLAQWLAHKSRAEVKVFVDTAPVMEKPIAQAAGLGWQGRHTNLVSREFGSWLFLGSIFTTLDLEPDEPARDSCGSCRACLDACPTGAFPAPYQIDARRCISYLTIENKGPIPHEFRAAMGNRIYGCDDCLAACPWNKFAKSANELRLKARPELEAPALAELAALDDPAFRALFRKSPVKRIGRDRFLRNVLIAIGNSGDQALADHARRLIHDPAPIVRGAAVWALSRLVDAKIFAALEDTYGEAEEDPEVRREWRTARAA